MIINGTELQNHCGQWVDVTHLTPTKTGWDVFLHSQCQP